MDQMQPEANDQDGCESLPQAVLPVPPVPTEEELDLFYSRVAASGIKPAILMVHPQYSALFQAPPNKEPQLLRNLSCQEASSEDLGSLIHHAEKFLEEMISAKRWYSTSKAAHDSSRNVRGTRTGQDASLPVMKSVCRTSTEIPSLSLLKKICHPERHKFSTPATTWGLDHEADAINSYVAEMKKQHASFAESRACGSAVSTRTLQRAQMLVECACCGKGTLEVECPQYAANKGCSQQVKHRIFALSSLMGACA